MSKGVAMNVRMEAHDAQWFACFVRRNGERDMREEPLRTATDDAKALALSDEPKRTGVVHNPHDRVSSHSFVSLSNVPIEHAIHRHPWICEEPVQRLAVGNRLHLLRKALRGVGSDQ